MTSIDGFLLAAILMSFPLSLILYVDCVLWTVLRQCDVDAYLCVCFCLIVTQYFNYSVVYILITDRVTTGDNAVASVLLFPLLNRVTFDFWPFACVWLMTIVRVIVSVQNAVSQWDHDRGQFRSLEINRWHWQHHWVLAYLSQSRCTSCCSQVVKKCDRTKSSEGPDDCKEIVVLLYIVNGGSLAYWVRSKVTNTTHGHRGLSTYLQS